MKVIIDVVPNHVARRYESISRPEGVEDFGANDDTSVEWARDNNFYYVVGEDFELPDFPPHYQPLGNLFVARDRFDGHGELHLCGGQQCLRLCWNRWPVFHD